MTGRSYAEFRESEGIDCGGLDGVELEHTEAKKEYNRNVGAHYGLRQDNPQICQPCGTKG
jgi:hypothetical protein